MTIDEPALPRDRTLIEKEAVAWFTRMSGKPTRAEKHDFSSWLEMSPDHLDAYNEVRDLLADVQATRQRIGRDEELAEPLERIAAYRRKRRRSKTATLAAGCLVAVAVSGWIWLENPNLIQNMAADYVTARSERQTITLPDGSTVLMDADSALDADNSPTERRVRLLRGAASFDVQPSQIPFIVEAGGGEVRVLGTQFDVNLNDQGVLVTLSRGSVQVSLDDTGQQVVLTPGESVEYNGAGLQAARAVDLEESTAWHEGRLIFNNARLADVVAQISRYRDGRIVLVGSSVGKRRVSGNISLDNTNAALRAMQSSVGFRMTSLAGKVTMIGP
ncbi:FecR family protein [Paracoccus sp. J55]|uniref:FecR family protein n=1 Tax=Paracoccus sp. J55 TaxID=935849 RepID=UPI000564A8D6|nr:FecR family protein [Paracoccus sp. J55]